MATKVDGSGAAVLTIKVVDRRGGGTTSNETTVKRVVGRPNLWGYTTAKKVLNESWMQAMGPMLTFIDNQLR